MEDQTNFYQEVCNKYGSWKDFIDSTSMRITGTIPWGKIDPEMHDIIRKLNNRKLYTISCCCGHGERSACITFDTSVTLQMLVDILNTSEVFTIVNESVNQLFGEDCVYYRLHFDFDRLNQTFKVD